MKLEDKPALEAVERLLDRVRESGRKHGKIEIIVEDGRATVARLVRVDATETLRPTG